MTRLTERYRDILGDHPDRHTTAVVRDLDQLFAADAPPTIRAAVSQTMEQRRGPGYPSKRRTLAATLRLPAVAAAIAVAAGALFFGLQQRQPAPVSAQTILQRAAAVTLPANSLIHWVYQSGSSSNGARADIWMQTDSSGHVVRTAQTSVGRTDGIITSISRYVDEGGIERDYEYQPTSQVIQEHTVTDAQLRKIVTRGRFSVLNILSGPDVEKNLMALMHHAPHGVHLLGLRRFMGAEVYVLRFDRELRVHGQNLPQVTFYIDAKTYIVRGIVGARHPFVGTIVPRTVLVKDQVLPVSAMPPHTFDYHPPKGALVIP